MEEVDGKVGGNGKHMCNSVSVAMRELDGKVVDAQRDAEIRPSFGYA